MLEDLPDGTGLIKKNELMNKIATTSRPNTAVVAPECFQKQRKRASIEASGRDSNERDENGGERRYQPSVPDERLTRQTKQSACHWADRAEM